MSECKSRRFFKKKAGFFYFNHCAIESFFLLSITLLEFLWRGGEAEMKQNKRYHMKRKYQFQ